MRKLDDNASAVPLILYILTIIVAGALFSLFFLEVAFPLLDMFIIPDSPSKTFLLYGFKAIPLIVLFVGCVALILSGLKNEQGWTS